MQLLAGIVAACATQIVFGYLCVSGAIRLKTICKVPHAQLYYELTLRGINWTTVREYDDEMLTGAILQLGGIAQRVDIAEVVCVESITPVLAYANPRFLPRTNNSFVKRGSRNERAWSDPLIGARSLHAKGYRGLGVKIGIIGSGVDYTHSALGGSFGPRNKVIGGYDFVGDDYTGGLDSIPQPSRDPLDQCNGHGTMIAGIIGANPGNPGGITGVAYEASLNVYRIYGCDGGTSDVVLIDALVRAKKDGNNVVIISLAPSDDWTTGAAMAVASRLAKAGIMVVIPTGNGGTSGFWRSWDNPERLGVVSVGSVRKGNSDDGEAYMAETSAYGPTNDLYMSPTVSAPGSDILSTFPVPLGSYQVDSDTSYAAAFFAGAAALWMQAHGKTRTSAKAALVAFQNTAIPLKPDLKDGFLTETLAHQGSGLIDAYNAIYTTSTMRPAQLLLNDTAKFRGVWKLSIRNMGKERMVYSLKNFPADTVPTIEGAESTASPKPWHFRISGVHFSSSRITVLPGSTETFELRFLPPLDVDPTTFPVYSGHIQATGSDGSVLRSVYIGLAASIKQMRILDDTSPHLGVVLPYIKNKNGEQINERTLFTMIGNDKPVLVYRLVGCTRILRVDLVSSSAPPRMYAHNKDWRSIWRNWKGWTLRTSTKHDLSYSPNVMKKTALMGPSESTVFGTIFERMSVKRHSTRSRTGMGFYSTVTIKAFADGSAIPNGVYRVSLRALKITGNPKLPSDWETWTSPEIVVERAEQDTPSDWTQLYLPHSFPAPKIAPVIRLVETNIWTFSVPFARFNFLPFGGRSTAVRLKSGDVWLLASTPCDDVTKKKLAEIGPVKYLIAPDLEHHLYLSAYKAVYPDAKVIGVPALVEKKKGEITFDGVYGQDPPETKYGYEPEIQGHYFPGFVNQDVAFLHVPSETLIEADLLFNLPGTEQYSNSRSSSKVPIIGKFGPSTSAHKSFVWRAGRDRSAMARDARVVASWDFDRIIPCHGNVIETGGNAAWREVYKWYLNPKTRF